MSIKHYILVLLTVAIWPLATKAQANGTKEKFTFAPLDWNIDIPEYYYIDSSNIQPSATIIDSTITPILLISKGTRNQMYSRLVPTELYQSVGGYEQFWKKFTQVQYKQATDFGDQPDTIKAPIIINGHRFTRFEMTTKSNGKITDYFCVYATQIKGKDFVTEILANNADDRDALTQAWKKSIATLKQ